MTIKKSVGKPQKHPRFSDDELQLIKDTFAENDELLKVCYKVFWQAPLSAEEKAVKAATFKGDLEKVLRKFFTPGLENEQLLLGIDSWLDVPIEGDLQQAGIMINARGAAIKYIEQQLNVLFHGGEEKLKFKALTPRENQELIESVVNLMTRKEIVNSVRNNFSALRALAGKRKESVEETMKKLWSDSNK